MSADNKITEFKKMIAGLDLTDTEKSNEVLDEYTEIVDGLLAQMLELKEGAEAQSLLLCEQVKAVNADLRAAVAGNENSADKAAAVAAFKGDMSEAAWDAQYTSATKNESEIVTLESYFAALDSLGSTWPPEDPEDLRERLYVVIMDEKDVLIRYYAERHDIDLDDPDLGVQAIGLEAEGVKTVRVIQALKKIKDDDVNEPDNSDTGQSFLL